LTHPVYFIIEFNYLVSLSSPPPPSFSTIFMVYLHRLWDGMGCVNASIEIHRVASADHLIPAQPCVWMHHYAWCPSCHDPPNLSLFWDRHQVCWVAYQVAKFRFKFRWKPNHCCKFTSARCKANSVLTNKSFINFKQQIKQSCSWQYVKICTRLTKQKLKKTFKTCIFFSQIKYVLNVSKDDCEIVTHFSLIFILTCSTSGRLAPCGD